MTHRHLSFKFANRFEYNAYNDEKRCTAERDKSEKSTGNSVEYMRYASNYTEEERSHKYDLVENLCYILRSRLSGTDSGDKSSLLHKVV